MLRKEIQMNEDIVIWLDNVKARRDVIMATGNRGLSKSFILQSYCADVTELILLAEALLRERENGN